VDSLSSSAFLEIIIHDIAAITCGIITRFISEQADLKFHQNYDLNGEIARKFLEMITVPLHLHIKRCIGNLVVTSTQSFSQIPAWPAG